MTVCCFQVQIQTIGQNEIKSKRLHMQKISKGCTEILGTLRPLWVSHCPWEPIRAHISSVKTKHRVTACTGCYLNFIGFLGHQNKCHYQTCSLDACKTISEGTGGDGTVPELPAPVPVEDSPSWAKGHQMRRGEVCKSGGPPREQAQIAKLTDLWGIKRRKRYTGRAVAQDMSEAG